MAVLVTGSTGFIAQHIVKLLLSKGYDVIGTVRLDAKGEKLLKNTAAVGPGKFSYEIVPDMVQKGAFDAVFRNHPEISVVLHTASPFLLDTTDYEKDLIIPAVEGTSNILGAIKAHVDAGATNIKRVVVTSSDAAIYSCKDEGDPSLSFDESLWNNTTHEEALSGDAMNAYYYSKACAEKLAWTFAEKPNFPPMTVVNPVFVFGPQAFDADVSLTLNLSNETLNQVLKAGPDGEWENDMGGFIDVRDIARAHLAAFEQENTVGKRLYMTNGQFSVQMVLDILNSQVPQLKGQIPVGKPGLGPSDILALAKTNNDATRNLLGFEFVPLDRCVIDVVNQVKGFKTYSKSVL
ncbi:hypothetical protein PUMCH_001621 [Australozyma saopauloensis]|uniref:NAD-dependent epimerase/dehydratase domain-containing protein n=1 Tax=Australozyma saopauloensis TaxID=291208 RepID=A0AAX4H819_9ASCO|nr:hypothetical protein PUMCH_001621 [[Candida] saopauloensis]